MSRKKVPVWSEELVFNEAKKYNTKSDFFINASGAYQAAKKLGIFEKACLHMKGKKWTFEALKAEASKYSSRSEFMRGSRSAHVMASRLGLLEEICAHIPTKQESWSASKVIEIASKYTSVKLLKKEQPNAYIASIRLGLHSDITSKLTFAHRTWSDSELHEVALGFTNIGDFRTKCKNQYMYASNRGILSLITSHMDGSVARQNMLYCISSNDTYENGMYLIKVGVSSTYRVDQRVLKHMRNHFTSADIVFITETKSARNYESFLLNKYDRKPHILSVIDGSTELRLVTGEELCEIVKYGNGLVGKNDK